MLNPPHNTDLTDQPPAIVGDAANNPLAPYWKPPYTDPTWDKTLGVGHDKEGGDQMANMKTTAISKKGKCVYARAGFWLEKDGSIHLAFEGVPGFHVAINDDPAKRNGHPTLFKRLARLLVEADATAPKA